MWIFYSWCLERKQLSSRRFMLEWLSQTQDLKILYLSFMKMYENLLFCCEWESHKSWVFSSVHVLSWLLDMSHYFERINNLSVKILNEIHDLQGRIFTSIISLHWFEESEVLLCAFLLRQLYVALIFKFSPRLYYNLYSLLLLKKNRFFFL